jgi:iron complex transport system permease protein
MFSLTDSRGWRPLAPWAGLLLALCTIVILQLTVGVVYVPPGDVVALLLGRGADDVWSRIVLDFRLPRVLTSLVAGASLGLSGLLLQTTFRNPLADPWFLGLVHGARLGVAVLVVLSGSAGVAILGDTGWMTGASLVVAAAAGALALTAVLVALAPRVSPVTLLLCGLMLGQTAQGLISVLLHFVSEAQGRVFDSWDDGTFTAVTVSQWSVLTLVSAAGFVAAVLLVKPLNTMLLGDDYARTLGLAVRRTRVAAITTATLLAGAVTAFCGPIAFLGILAPHAARAVFATADHRVLVPAAGLLGAGLAATADLITHLPWGRHFFHMNAALGLVGGPLVVILLLRHAGLRRFEV